MPCHRQNRQWCRAHMAAARRKTLIKIWMWCLEVRDEWPPADARLTSGLSAGPPPEARGRILPYSGGLWRYWCEVTPGDRAASAASSYDGLCGQVRTWMEPRSEVCQCHLSGQLLFYFVKGNCVNILRRNRWSKQNLHTHFILAKKNTNTTN